MLMHGVTRAKLTIDRKIEITLADSGSAVISEKDAGILKDQLDNCIKLLEEYRKGDSLWMEGR